MNLRIFASASLLLLGPAAAAQSATPPALARADSLELGGIPRAEYASRRAAFAAAVQDGLVIVLGAPEPEHDYDRFFQSPDFQYLTGLEEPNALLLMRVHAGIAASVLFVEPRDPAQEVWVGRRFGPDGAAAITGIPSRPSGDISTVTDSLSRGAPRVLIIGKTEIADAAENDGHSLALRAIAALAKPGVRIDRETGRGLIAALRARKSPAELTLLRRAIEITIAGHSAAASTVRPGLYEYDIEAALEHAFRTRGSERPGFSSIVGSGPNSTTLHYNRNDRLMQAGDVVVVDIGASWRGYTGDMTRTYPVAGRFTPDQRAIYQIVRDAQSAAERAVVNGAPAGAMSQAARATVAAGLARLGLIESPDATYECSGPGSQCPQYRLYYMHGLGHAIGLVVHDPGTSGVQPGTLTPGDVFSIEPGIYVRRELLSIIPTTPRNEQLKARIRGAVERYADIGVRIEDDYVLTNAGLEWLTRFAREPDEIEALLSRR